MIISKSLFKEFINMPQLAWFSKNDKETYKLINEIRYAGIDGQAVGQAVEDAVMALLADKHIVSVDTNNLWYTHRHQNYHKKTQEAMATNADVIYQPGFLVNNMYCKCDFLVKNESWTYDLREVKAKNSIRKKSKAEPLLDDLIADISFQDYILKQALWIMYSWKTYILHLNKQYVKQWKINFSELIIKDDVSEEMMESSLIERIVETVDEAIPLTKEMLDIRYPYTGQDHLSYFWTPPPKDSVWKIPRIWAKLWSIYQQEKRRITDLNEVDIEWLRKSNWEESSLMTYVRLRQSWETSIDKDAITQQFETLKFPLFFYDYETISAPIPIFEHTHPWQQVIVQYSCHKIDEDWSVTHSEWLIESGQHDFKPIIEKLLQDLEHWNGTYVVWYEWFENKRNEEVAKMYPEFEAALMKINENTFDLMTVFSTWNYFDRRFQWSSSIKKVLPVLTDISYDNLAIPNGAIASGILSNLAKWLLPADKLDSITQNLLTYCKQDTWAMVRIWEEVKKKLTQST